MVGKIKGSVTGLPRPGDHQGVFFYKGKGHLGSSELLAFPDV